VSAMIGCGFGDRKPQRRRCASSRGRLVLLVRVITALQNKTKTADGCYCLPNTRQVRSNELWAASAKKLLLFFFCSNLGSPRFVRGLFFCFFFASTGMTRPHVYPSASRNSAPARIARGFGLACEYIRHPAQAACIISFGIFAAYLAQELRITDKCSP